MIEHKLIAYPDGSVVGPSGRVLKPKCSGGKYAKVSYKAPGNKVRHKYVHRLVAEQHLPNPLNLRYVNHIDGDTLNNHVSNLEWCTAAYNTRHAIGRGLIWNIPKKGQQGFVSSPEAS